MGKLIAALEHGKRVVPTIVALAIALRIAVMLVWPQAPYSDGEFYMLRAAEMARGMGYQEGGHPTAFWPVGYPAVVAAGMKLLGPGLLGPMLINLAAAAIIMGCILWFGRAVAASELAARTAALLYALYPAHVVYTGAPLSETLSTAVTMLAFALLVARRGDWRFLLLSGLLFGAATLTRPQVMLFPVGAIVALLLVYRDFGWRAAIRAAVLVHLALFTAILPWSLRNQDQLGSFVLVSTNGGVALYTGANALATGDHMAVEREPALWRQVAIPFDQRVERQVELDRRLRALAVQHITARPADWLALGPVKTMLLWRKDSDAFWGLSGTYPDRAQLWTALQWINQLFYMALLALAAACFITGARSLLRRDEGTAPLLLLACMPAFVTLLAFAFTGQIRYHYPAMPFVIIAAGWTLARLAQSRRAGAATAPAGLPSHA